MARAVLVGPVAPYLGKSFAWSTSFGPGECPHALVTWREIRLPSGRPHFVPVELRCRTEARLIPHTEHVTLAGDRWR